MCLVMIEVEKNKDKLYSGLKINHRGRGEFSDARALVA